MAALYIAKIEVEMRNSPEIVYRRIWSDSFRNAALQVLTMGPLIDTGDDDYYGHLIDARVKRAGRRYRWHTLADIQKQ